jgi:hypothetical protein
MANVSTFKAVATVRSAGGVAVRYSSGKSTTSVLAIAELKAVLAMVVGAGVESINVTETITDDAGAAVTGYPLGGTVEVPSETAVFIFQKYGTHGKQTRTVKLENILLSLKVAETLSNDILLTAPLVTTYETAYYDATGVTGYTLTPNSHFTK